ncbi:tlde1 domain-containing protein [uncultured Methylobacterium sp.]|uniref:tlde1 domain-containing protein n=1 Tax=uncultured Methylobacterium sp. TaxID=157278 RepID=UPI0035C9D351
MVRDFLPLRGSVAQVRVSDGAAGRVMPAAALVAILGALALGGPSSSSRAPSVGPRVGAVQAPIPAPTEEAVLTKSSPGADATEPVPALSIIPLSGPRFAEKNDATTRRSKQACVVEATQACLGIEAPATWRSALLEPMPGVWPPGADAEPSTPSAQGEPAPPPEASPQETSRLAQTVPLPVPRPPEFRRPSGAERVRRADRRTPRAVATAPAPAEDTRSFFEKLFGVERSPAPALAYAALERSPADALPRRRLIPQLPPAGGTGTAVYDISARTVTLPSGQRLEAHSGLGEAMDDPRTVHLRMRGATPPGTYDVAERAQPFHGVRALRLSPVDGEAAVYGRVGLLAHTYMLGPSGASNGCVSFKNYDAFLQAYLRGEIQRLVVVPGGGQDALPSLANRGSFVPGRSARLGGDV